MTNIDLSSSELDVLVETLERALNELNREIAETENPEYRQMLATKDHVLRTILQSLPKNIPIQVLKETNVIGGMRVSRRLGRSLAVNVIPRKVCPLDCIYCETGRTSLLTDERRAYIEPDVVIAQLRSFLREYRGSIDHLTLSASGEPTLNSKLGEIIAGIRGISAIPVAILTNGVLLHRDDVRWSLMDADVVLPSLDAVSEPVFRLVNRPHAHLSAGDLIDGLTAFRSEYTGQIWLEILIVRGFNDFSEELEKLAKAVERIQPDRIHLNTVVRTPVERFARPADIEVINRFRERLGPRCSVL
ncbi:MAG: radical SAM protein [Ignavibacteria bacterium]|nr:radical SAM protein [Ignavibacteria bacterium]